MSKKINLPESIREALPPFEDIEAWTAAAKELNTSQASLARLYGVTKRTIGVRFLNADPDAPRCSARGCDKAATISGLCNTHYQRKRNEGKYTAREEHWQQRLQQILDEGGLGGASVQSQQWIYRQRRSSAAGRLSAARRTQLDQNLPGWEAPKRHHRKPHKAAKPLTQPASTRPAAMRVGDPDGHGHYGQLDTDLDGLLICHECGQAYAQLATHTRLAHGMTAADYRQAHGLGATTRLVSASTSAAMRAAYDRHRDQHLKALATHRDPAAATAASRHTTWAPQTRAKRQATAHARRGRPLTATETAALAGDTDLQAWADTARRLLQDPKISARSIAEACDIATPTVHQRLRRYP